MISIALAMIDQPTIAAQPVRATNCVPGLSRMNRVSVSDLRKSRCSGK